MNARIGIITIKAVGHIAGGYITAGNRGESIAIAITISIGITAQVLDNIDTMIAAADALLYRAKEGGRNRVAMDGKVDG